jgi:GDSL-like lipase/acylhydrolase family protein
MTLPSGNSLRGIDYFVIGALTLGAIYLYAGFFFPDSYILSYGTHTRKILWFIRICVPLFYAGSVVLYVRARLRRFDRGALLLMIVSSLVCLAISYGIADSYYQNWFDRHRKAYHPYLQLMPPALNPTAGNAPVEVSVFCLGGSTTEFPDSSGVDWPSRVERILRTSYGMPSVRVYNLGMEWYTSLHTLINYETNLRPRGPSVILYMESVNDLLQNADFSYFSRGRFREDYGHFYGPVNRIIDRRSLWVYLRDVIGRLWYARPRRVITTGTFPGLTSYRRNIGTLVEMARHDSSRVVLMTEPSLFKPVMSDEELAAVGMLRAEAINDSLVWSSETARSGMEQYNNTLKEIAERNNLLLIDLEKEVPKSLLYFRDEVHYRDTTFPLIARFVAARLHEILGSRGKE